MSPEPSTPPGSTPSGPVRPPSGVRLAPSILASDFTRLGEQLAEVSAAEYLHVDVMDGLFVPNISFGFPVLEATRRVVQASGSGQFIDVHLMIERPERYLEQFAQAGADGMTVHVEATPHIHRCLQQIAELGRQPGVVVNPGTPLEALRPLLPFAGMVLIMSVNPGFGGQPFLEQTYERVRTVRGWLDDLGSPALLQVDGGVGPGNARRLADAGATCLVAGSSVFGPDGGTAGLARLRAALAGGPAGDGP